MKLHRRLEKVNIEPHRPVELPQLEKGPFSFKSIIADQLPYDHTIFLLHITLVVLLIGTPSCKCDFLPFTVSQEFRIDKFTAIVRIQTNKRKRQYLTDVIKTFNDSMPTAEQKRQAFNPTGSNVS